MAPILNQYHRPLGKMTSLILGLVSLAFMSGCLYQNPLTPRDPLNNPVAPFSIPTVSATPMPGQYPEITLRALGQVPCSGSTNGSKVGLIRSAADWSAWTAASCAGSPAWATDLGGFDFGAETVLILQQMDCGNIISDGVHIWNVYDRGSYLEARSDINSFSLNPAVPDCRSFAVAIPVTSLGVAWSICKQSPSYHCVQPITP